tara:strand:- start:29 stop:418 length:390 start_codon:yes stop_codon:yes gene_type:complete
MNNIKQITKLIKTHLNNDSFKHSISVAKLTTTKNKKEFLTALLHDSLEDSNIKEIDLIKLVSDDIINAVKILTRTNNETYKNYIKRIKNSKNKLAIKIKLMDIKDHLNKKETLKDTLKTRYIKALKELY